MGLTFVVFNTPDQGLGSWGGSHLQSINGLDKDCHDGAKTRGINQAPAEEIRCVFDDN